MKSDYARVESTPTQVRNALACNRSGKLGPQQDGRGTSAMPQRDSLLFCLVLLATTFFSGTVAHAQDNRVTWDNGAAGSTEFTDPVNWRAVADGANKLPGYAPGGNNNGIIQGNFTIALGTAPTLGLDFTPANTFSNLVVRFGSELGIAANLNLAGIGFQIGTTNNTDAGNVFHSAGTATVGQIQLGHASAPANSATYRLSGTGVLDATNLVIQQSGKLRLTDDRTVAVPITIQSTNSGSITSDSGENTISGPITLNSSADFRGPGQLTVSGGIVSSGNESISLNLPAHVQDNPIELNNGALTITSNGNNPARASELNVAGNDWSFARINFDGYLKLGADNVMPADAGVQFGWHLPSSSAGTLDLQGTSQTVRHLAASTPFPAVSGDQNVTGGGTLTINLPSGSEEYLGRITNGATPTNLVKTGLGTQSINNQSGTPSSNTGTVAINQGTLAFSSAASFGMPSSVQIESGAQLSFADAVSGGGTINLFGSTQISGTGSIDVTGGTLGWDSGMTIAPGDSPGILGISGNAFWDGGTYEWELLDFAADLVTGATDGDYDQIQITGGGLALDNAMGTIILAGLEPGMPPTSGEPLNFLNGTDYSYTILTTTDPITGIGTFSPTFVNNLNVPIANPFLSVDGTNLILNFTTVPEPANAALLALLLATLWFASVRSRRKGKTD